MRYTYATLAKIMKDTEKDIRSGKDINEFDGKLAIACGHALDLLQNDMLSAFMLPDGSIGKYSFEIIGE